MKEIWQIPDYRAGLSLIIPLALAAGGYDVEKNNNRLKLALKGLVIKETLIQLKGSGASGSFKLNKKQLESKEKTVKKKAADKPKKPTAKKAAKALQKTRKAPKAAKSLKKSNAAKTKKAVKSPGKKPVKSPAKKPEAAKSPAKAKAATSKAAMPKRAAPT
ncbi:hypothetical protein FKM82_008592 [Ascaphus truei]